MHEHRGAASRMYDPLCDSPDLAPRCGAADRISRWRSRNPHARREPHIRDGLSRDPWRAALGRDLPALVQPAKDLPGGAIREGRFLPYPTGTWPLDASISEIAPSRHFLRSARGLLSLARYSSFARMES